MFYTRKKTLNATRIFIGPTIFLLLVTGLAHADWKSEWDKTVRAAKKEGQLRLWGDTEITHPGIVAPFNKKFPFIKVITITGKVGRLMPRIFAERRAGKYLADIYGGGLGGRAFYDFFRSGVLAPIKPTLVMPEVTDGSNWLNGKHYYVDPDNRYVFMFEGNVGGTGLRYNTNLVRDKELKSFWDLLNPKWKGKILLFERLGVGSPTLQRVYYNPQLGPKFIRRLLTEADITVSLQRRQATDWLGSGKFPLCIDCADVDRAKKQGVPVEKINPRNIKEAGVNIGTGGNSGPGLINQTSNPNAAKVFLNWYLSRAGQSTWQRVMNTIVIEPSNSMRIDISKDDVLPEARREKGRTYKVTGFLNPDPVQKLVKELRRTKN